MISLKISPLLLDYHFNYPVLSTLRKMLHVSNNARRFSGRRPRRRTLEERKRKGRHYVTLRFSDEEWKEIREGAAKC